MCLGLDGVELPEFGVLDGAFGAGGGQRQAPQENRRVGAKATEND